MLIMLITLIYLPHHATIKTISSSALSMSCCKSTRSNKENWEYHIIRLASHQIPRLNSYHSSNLRRYSKGPVIRWVRSENCRSYLFKEISLVMQWQINSNLTRNPINYLLIQLPLHLSTRLNEAK